MLRNFFLRKIKTVQLFFNHFEQDGEVYRLGFVIQIMAAENGMVDISEKPVISRTAMAGGILYLNPTSIASIRDKTNPKGDVLENAKLAAIHAVKKTPEMVFMCHPLRINSVKVYFDVHDDRVVCMVQVVAHEKTGVEIEAMAGVSNALLAIFDLCKRFEKDENGQYHTTKMADIRVINKEKKVL